MINIAVYCLLVYLMLCGFLYAMQERLMFLPPQVDEELYRRFDRNTIEIKVNDIHAHGWKINQQKNNQKTLIYFGGNAEDVVYMNLESDRFNVDRVIALNYPGYGRSQGKPGQETMYRQALISFDELVDKKQIDMHHTILMGRSLGGSIASYVASSRQVAGLILITPFDSMQEVARYHYRLFPVAMLLRHAFPTAHFMGDISAPVLVLAAKKDEIVAEKNLQNLQQKIVNLKKIMRYEGFGHNTIQLHPEYYRDINAFIDSLQ